VLGAEFLKRKGRKGTRRRRENGRNALDGRDMRYESWNVAEKYEPVDLGFSTADGERPELRFVNGDIKFSFVDWREELVRFTASDVRAFSWVEVSDVPEIRDDCCYEVYDSDLIQKYRSLNLISAEPAYRHLKLCFNAAGVLDIVCKDFVVTKEP
jgi:hypothetical protein